MSWFLIVQAPLGQQALERMAGLARSEDVELQSPRPELRLMAKGSAPRFHEWDSPARGGLVAGLGFEPGSDGLYDLMDWQRSLTGPADPREALDGLQGHWALLRWQAGRLEVCTDPLGLRPVYHAQLRAGGHCFSTRLDLIARLLGSPRLDLGAFGASWLWPHPLGPTAPLAGVERLPAGTWCVAEGGTLTRAEQPWLPETGGDPEGRLVRTLEVLFRQQTPSLALSGGLDSRFLLAIFQRHFSDRPWQVHSFGSPEEPDTALAARIATEQQLPHRILDAPLPAADDLPAALTDVYRHGGINQPLTSWLHLRHFPSLLADHLSIDGAFAEIARDVMAKWWRYAGAKAFRHGQVDWILRNQPQSPHRRFGFAPEALEAMGTQQPELLRQSLAQMPELSSMPFNDWLNLLLIRTIAPAINGPEQARLDNFGLSLVPFLQPAVLVGVFALSHAERTRSRWTRRLLRQYAPELQHYPLIKNQESFPFWLDEPERSLLSRLRRSLGRRPAPPPRQAALFEGLHEWLLDTLRSQDVRQFPAYEAAQLDAAAEALHAGPLPKELRSRLDTWVPFELWRQALGITGVAE